MGLVSIPNREASALDPRLGLCPPEDDGVWVDPPLKRHSGAALLSPESRAESFAYCFRSPRFVDHRTQQSKGACRSGMSLEESVG